MVQFVLVVFAILNVGLGYFRHWRTKNVFLLKYLFKKLLLAIIAVTDECEISAKHFEIPERLDDETVGKKFKLI